MRDALVLVVEDNRDNREGIAEYLTSCGFRVSQAAGATEALEQVRQNVPSAIVLDLHLPDMDGFELARQLRGSPETQGVRLIAFSACVFPQDHARAREAGCDDFIEKPAAPTVVVAALDRLLGTNANGRS